MAWASPYPAYVECRGVVLMLPLKCASGSLKSAVARQLGLDDAPGCGRNLRWFSSIDLASRDMLRVGVVRDPVARVVSCWRDKVAGRFVGWLLPYGLTARTTWDEFVDVVCRTPDAKADGHWRDMSHTLVLGGRQPDVLLRVERLSADWAALESRLGWQVLGVPVINATGTWSPAAAPVVTDAQRSRLRQRYVGDYGLFSEALA